MNVKHIGRRTLFSAAAAMIVISILAVDHNAQTSRRKKPAPRPVATATPPVSEPLIISRAEDFPDEQATTVDPQTVRAEDPTAVAERTRKTIEELQNRLKTLEAKPKADTDEKQKRLALNLEILTRAEQRSETLRKQHFEMIEKENTIKSRLDVIEIDLRPEAIDRSVALAGTLRPEELRTMRRKNLEVEKANLQNLMNEIQKNRANLDQNVQKADILVEKLRIKLEKEIDKALEDEPEGTP